MKSEKGYHFLIIFLWPYTVCKCGTGKTGRTSSLDLNCGTGNGWNWLWNRGAPSDGWHGYVSCLHLPESNGKGL